MNAKIISLTKSILLVCQVANSGIFAQVARQSVELKRAILFRPFLFMTLLLLRPHPKRQSRH